METPVQQLTLGTDTTTNEPVTISQSALLQGTYVLGLQGFGKTGLFENMMGQLIAQGSRLAFIDPHGQAAEHILNVRMRIVHLHPLGYII